jgi:small subunit ribosomal protein S20
MAIHKSAKKRIRSTATRTARNKARTSQMRSSIRKIEEAIAKGDKAGAAKALQAAQPKIQRTAGKGIIHKRTASRKISRLSQKIKKIGDKK